MYGEDSSPLASSCVSNTNSNAIVSANTSFSSYLTTEFSLETNEPSSIEAGVNHFSFPCNR